MEKKFTAVESDFDMSGIVDGLADEYARHALTQNAFLPRRATGTVVETHARLLR